MKNLIFIIALIIKFTIVYFLFRFTILNIDTQLPFYKQNFFVWILIYLPIMIGYEFLIGLIYKNKK